MYGTMNVYFITVFKYVARTCTCTIKIWYIIQYIVRDTLCMFLLHVHMQDLNALGPRLQLDLLRDWPKLALDRELWRGVASRC